MRQGKSVGRHSGEPRQKMRRDGSLFGWGIFLGIAVVTAAAVTGLDVLGAGMVAGGLVLVFTGLWYFSPRPRQD